MEDKFGNIIRGYATQKQVFLYVEPEVFDRLHQIIPAGNSVILGTILSDVMGEDFTMRHADDWPRSNVPWTIDKTIRPCAKPMRGKTRTKCEKNRVGKMGLFAWFPSHIVDDARAMVKNNKTIFGNNGARTLHKALLQYVDRMINEKTPEARLHV